MHVKNFIKFFIFSVIIVSSLSVAISNADQTPTDIQKHWGKDAILSAASEGWAYIEKDKFNPNKTATREEVIWMLVGACDTVKIDKFDKEKKADMTKYKDKPSEWAKIRMSEAIGNGLISGYSDGTIKPKASITRAEFAVIMGRLIDKNAWYKEQYLPFADFIPSWAFKGLQTAYKNGIVKGYADNTFKPNAKVTKAEALVMIERWQKLNPLKPVPCQEFKKIVQILSLTEMNDDNSILLYYGPKGKTTSTEEEKFYISHLEDGNFTVVLSDFKDRTYKDLQFALGTVLPTSAGKLIAEIKSMEDINKKEITLDNKKVGIYIYPSYTAISIKK